MIPAVAAIALLAAATLPAAAALGATGAPRYAVTILSTLSPDPNLSSLSNAAGVNDRGWIVGDANYPGTWQLGDTSYGPNTTEHATVWRNGQITDLGTLGGPNSSIGFVARPNNTGLISGNAQSAMIDPFNEGWALNLSCTASGASCPGSQYELLGFVWKNGVMRQLPTLGGNNALAFGVGNNRGQLVGTAENATHDPTCQSPQVLDWRPVVWGPNSGAIHQLPLYRGDRVGAASAISDKGQVVGGSGICLTLSFGALEHALLWQGRSMINLGSLGGTYDNLGTAINNRGQVVGWSDLAGDTTPTNGTTHAFLWQNGVMTDLGTLPGDAFSFAYGINDHGQVVGQSCNVNGVCRAFLWQDGAMTDLNMVAHVITPGAYVLPLAEGVNAQGEIVGTAVDQNTGNTLGFSAVPCDNVPANDSGCAANQNTTAAGGPKAIGPEFGLGPLRGRLSFGPLGHRAFGLP